MKYLDENIIFEFAIPVGGSGSATFILNVDQSPAFYGQVYIPSNLEGSTYPIDVTDICAALRWNNNLIPMSDQMTAHEGYSVERWKCYVDVDLTLANNSTISDGDVVWMWYRYTETHAVPNGTMPGDDANYMLLLQPGLAPHAPLIRSANNKLISLKEVLIDSPSGWLAGEIIYEFAVGSNMYIGAQDGDVVNGYILDGCPARYYLRWNDRAGSVQQQPMTGKRVYSEDIEKQTIENASGRRRDVVWNVTPKWELNTGFLTGDLMPIYESILVSPYLSIYDTVEDRNYLVICKDTKYVHKTYKNDKMFNMKIQLELDKRQTITN